MAQDDERKKIASVLEDLINSIRYEFSKTKTLDLKKVKMAVICEGIVRTEEDHVHKTLTNRRYSHHHLL